MSSHFRGDKLGEGGQIGERVTNSVGGQTWVLDKQGMGTNGRGGFCERSEQICERSEQVPCRQGSAPQGLEFGPVGP